MYTGVARTVASDSDALLFDAGGGVELTLAVVGHVVRATDRLVVATVAYRLETLSHVEVMAHSTLEVLTTATVQTIRHHLQDTTASPPRPSQQLQPQRLH